MTITFESQQEFEDAVMQTLRKRLIISVESYCPQQVSVSLNDREPFGGGGHTLNTDEVFLD